MHRRKLRKYRILKDICAVVGGIAVLVMAGSADSYSQNLISTAEFFYGVRDRAGHDDSSIHNA